MVIDRNRRRIIGLAALGLAGGFICNPASAITTYTNGGKDGRFVRVQNNGSQNRNLHIGEIEVFAGGVTPSNGSGLSANDLAATFEADGAIASFATTGGHSFSTAVLVNNNLESGGGTYSRSGVGTFAIIDLGSTQDVGTVRSWQRTDCCGERLSNYTVSLLADNGGLPGAVVASQVFEGQPALANFGATTFTTKTINPGGAGIIGTDTELGTDGRFIKVTTLDTTTNDGNSFHIGEIRAFDTSATNVALATNGSTAATLNGQGGHGIDSALINGALDTGGTTWSRNGTSFGGLAGAGAVVDLNQVRDLTSITVHQRNDTCCQSRLRDFTVTVESTNGIVLDSQYFPGQVADNSFATFNLPDLVVLEYGDTLVIDIDGATKTSDLLKVGNTGNGTIRILDGAHLVLNFLSTPGAGDTYNIMDFGTLTGEFSTITVNGFDINRLGLDNLYTTGQISIIPEPVSGLLTMAGFAMLGLRSRRRNA